MSVTVRTGVRVGVASVVAAWLAVGVTVSAAALEGTVTQLTTSPDGQVTPPTSPSVSDDGRYVAFERDQDVFLLDTTTATTVLVSRAPDGAAANGWSHGTHISANGKFVVFTSAATNLTADSAGQTERQVFRYAVASGKTIRVSRTSTGGPTGQLSGDASVSATGRYITYMSYAGNVVAGDTNGRADIFRYDALAGTTIRVSRTPSGGEPDRNSSFGVVSPDGRYVAYATGAQNMGPSDTNGSIDTYLYDVATDTTTLASHGASGTAVGKTYPTGVSNGGAVVAMTSTSPRLAPADTDKDYDAFVYRARSDSVGLVNPSTMVAVSAGISADGRYAVYQALPSDGTQESGVNVLDRTANESVAVSGSAAAPSLSANGRFIVFVARAPAPAASIELFLWTRTS